MRCIYETGGTSGIICQCDNCKAIRKLIFNAKDKGKVRVISDEI